MFSINKTRAISKGSLMQSNTSIIVTYTSQFACSPFGLLFQDCNCNSKSFSRTELDQSIVLICTSNIFYICVSVPFPDRPNSRGVLSPATLSYLKDNEGLTAFNRVCNHGMMKLIKNNADTFKIDLSWPEWHKIP